MELIAGCAIYTQDGDCIGTLGEHGAGAIQVLAAGQPPYWLRTEAIAVAIIHRITLAVPRAQVPRYRAAEPLAA